MLGERRLGSWLPEAERALAGAERLLGGSAAGATNVATPLRRHARGWSGTAAVQCVEAVPRASVKYPVGLALSRSCAAVVGTQLPVLAQNGQPRRRSGGVSDYLTDALAYVVDRPIATGYGTPGACHSSASP